MSLLLILIDVALRATLVLLAALLVTLALRRAAAATRHLVWTLALVGLLLLPALTLLPGWQLPIVAPWSDTTPSAAGNPEPGNPTVAVVVQAKPAPIPWKPAWSPPEFEERGAGGLTQQRASAPAAPATDAPLDLANAAPVAAAGATTLPALEFRLLTLWAAGAGFCVLTIGLAMIRLRHLRRQCIHIPSGPIHELATQLAAALGIRRRFHLVQSPQRVIPMTWGVWRPTLLLPTEASAWDRDKLRMVLIHELGHIARWDCATHLLGYLARCLYWFHPLAWWALAQQRREQEKACDDLVMTHGAAPHEYAEHLLGITARLPAAYFASSLALGITRSSRLKDRLVAVLDSARRRHAVSRPVRYAGGLICLLALVPLASAKWAVPAMVVAGTTPMAVLLDGDDPAQPMTPEALRKLEEIRKKLREFYVTPLDDKKLTDAAIKGLLQELKDPYTDYLPAEELAAFDAQIKGGIVGIGAQLKLDKGRIMVLSPLDNSPALKAGLRAGDVIEAIDGEPTRGTDLTQAVKRIVGTADTIVKLKIQREDGVVEELAIKRGPVRVGSVHGVDRLPDGAWRHLLDGEHKIAYLRITQFNSQTAKEVRDAIAAAGRDTPKGLVLDLRCCPGGLLDQALKVCNLFIAKGQLLTIKGPGDKLSSFQADGKTTLGDFPMVVLVNELTASAAEIVAGVLRDHNRAVILGTRTYGRGSVQSIVKLDEGGALKLTTAYHYLPSGRTMQKRPGEATWGVDPSDGFYVPLTRAQLEAFGKNRSERAVIGLRNQPMPPERLTTKVLEEQYADPQLAAAQRTLVGRLTGGEFLKVGQSPEMMQVHLQKLEELRQRREGLMQSLQQLDRDIDAVQQSVGAKK